MTFPPHASPTRPLAAASPAPSERGEDLAERVRSLEAKNEMLLELLTHQQRVAQAGLVTAGLAHDVDNHVQIIIGSAYLAARRDNPEDWKSALDKIQEQCLALTETTRAFLGFVQRRNALEKSEFDIAQVVDETRRLVQPMARHHGVEIAVDGAQSCGTLRGERRLAIQAIVNIVSNAVRACSGSDGARVAITVLQPAPGTCRVTIRDNGPGIPDQMRGRLFRPFASGSDSEGGNGLGLFIVRQNIRRLGGTIRVRSSNEGAAFEINLPCSGAQCRRQAE